MILTGKNFLQKEISGYCGPLENRGRIDIVSGY
jgi:hypothetical protein